MKPVSPIFKNLLKQEEEKSKQKEGEKQREDVIVFERAKKLEFEDEKLTNPEPQNDFKTEEILAKAAAWKISKYKDDYRKPPADEIGGLPLVDQRVMEILRSVAKEFVKQFFGKILSGNFNLTTISFPIKCMRPVSLIETFSTGGALNPLYMNKAGILNDPVERMKYIIIAQISTFYYTSQFLKPVFLIFLIQKA